MSIEFLEEKAAHPSAQDLVFGGPAPSYARVRFIDGRDNVWTGAFAGTGVNHNTFARRFGPAGAVLVVAQGQGYVVDPPRRVLRFTTDDDYLFDARGIPGRDLIVACSCVDLWAYNSDGEVWLSDHIALDGIGLSEATPDSISGWRWQEDGWYGFTLQVDGFRMELGGLLSRYDRAYPDPGLTAPPAVLPEDSAERGSVV